MAFGNERWEQFGIAMADIGDGPCVSPGTKLFQSKICVLMLFTNNLENKILLIWRFFAVFAFVISFNFFHKFGFQCLFETQP